VITEVKEESEDEVDITEEEIERRADAQVTTDIEDDLKNLIQDPSKFSFCRVGLRKKGEEYIPTYHGKDGE